MDGAPALYTTRFPLMGGPALVRFVDARGRAAAAALARAAEDEGRRIEAKFSRYRASSIVSHINRRAGGRPVEVDAETALLIRAALDLSALTGGRFDPTVGALRTAWDFTAPRVPSRDEVAAGLARVDASAVVLEGETVVLAREGMELDLGGVGKEYAVDRVAELLRAEGITAALVNFAGDVRTLGTRGDGRPWSIGVVDPRDTARCRFAVRAVGDVGVATSGDYERFFVAEGVRYHHILDAHTGWPARGLASATAVAAGAFLAGRFATAAFLLGPADGLALLERAPGVEGALIDEQGTIHATRGMDRLSDLPGSLYAGVPSL